MDELGALQAFKTVLATVTPPPGNAPLAGVYIWPTEFSLTPDTLALPAIVVCPGGVGEGMTDTISYRQRGLEEARWAVDVLVYVAEGPLTGMNEIAAAAEAKVIGWKKALVDVLWPDRRIGNHALLVGEYVGEDFVLLSAAVGHLDWGIKRYWGIRARVPVKQTRRVTVGP